MGVEEPPSLAVVPPLFVLDYGVDLIVFVGGKSAILTALCVAFGSRAKGTQRASTLKDFIKTGCRFHDLVAVVFGNLVVVLCSCIEFYVFGLGL